jgi:hypothetical protein
MPARAKAFHPARRDKVPEGAKETRPFLCASLCARAGRVKGDLGPALQYESVCFLTASPSRVGRWSEKAGCWAPWILLAHCPPAAAGWSANENGGLRMKDWTSGASAPDGYMSSSRIRVQWCNESITRCCYPSAPFFRGPLKTARLEVRDASREQVENQELPAVN